MYGSGELGPDRAGLARVPALVTLEPQTTCTAAQLPGDLDPDRAGLARVPGCEFLFREPLGAKIIKFAKIA